MNPFRVSFPCTCLLAFTPKTSKAAFRAALGSLALFAILTASSVGWAQEAAVAPKMAPLNPHFVQHMDDLSHGRSMGLAITPEGRPLGFRPSPMDLSHLKGQPGLAAQAATSLPSSYDLRNYGRVSPVKDQLRCGDCWAFAAYGSMESVLLTDESWNFSENNLNNLSGFDFGVCRGGNGNMSTAYLARWAGPIKASADPDPTSCSSTNTCYNTSPSNLPAQKHVQGVYFIAARANSTDNSNLKAAIMTYGGVDTTISANELGGDNPYWNSDNNAYYYDGTAVCQNSYGDAVECPVDHAITLVGWDDEYPASKFSTAPPGNGAFLIKNSWGTYFGDSGYFWISYYDVELATGESYVFVDNASTTNYTTEYQYDPLGYVGAEGYETTTAWAANVFTASANGQLSAVATYALSNNTSYKVEIYTNATSGPTSGSLASTASGTISLAGYNTITLPSPATLTKGQKFSVVIKLTTPGYDYPIPVEYAYSGYSSKATASAGQSYISYDGSTWQDTTTVDSTMNVSLKAFSNASTAPTLSATPTFTPAAGTYSTKQSVTIKDATAKAIIYYTTNGKVPTTSSTKYTVPVVVSATETIKAIAVAAGYSQSAVGAAAYTIKTTQAPTATTGSAAGTSARTAKLKGR